MRRLWSMSLVLAALLAVPALSFGAEPAAATCSKHNTSVEFFDTPQDAATQAKKDGKLVLVLHISGIFEDPGLT